MDYNGPRKWLRMIRLEKELSQAKLASMVGTSQSAYNLIEQGCRNPSDELKAKIAEALEFPVERFEQEDLKREAAT